MGGQTMSARPIVKWAGGKSKLVGELLARAPNAHLRYFEPFLGGGALFFRLAPRAAVLSDANPDLIGCYQAVRDHVEAVIRALAHHRDQHGERHYYEVRDQWNQGCEPAGSPERAATFIYLNKTCYNGLWRVNRSGGFNVPMGRYVNPPILDPANLRAAAHALARVRLDAAPFERVLDEADAGDFVYFDPPYVPVSETADFTNYTAEGFGPAEQERLAQVVRTLADRGCAVMVSNSDTPRVRCLYAGLRVDRVMCARAINSKAGARGAAAEVIVWNG